MRNSRHRSTLEDSAPTPLALGFLTPFRLQYEMAVSRVAIIMLVAMLAGVQSRSAQGASETLPTLMQLAKQMIAERQGDAAEIDRQAIEQDSYLEALEYSHNSASLQGEDGRFVQLFRNVQNAISEAGVSRGGIAAALAVPLVAVGSLALLSPLALGRKKRDLDGLEESEEDVKSPDAVQRLRSRVTGIYSEVLGSEECIERMVCELGSATKSIYYKDSVYRVVNYFAPAYKKYMKTLKNAAYTDSSKCELIKCQPIGL